MNLTFKTVWDENRQCWIAVQENTRARGKRSTSSRRIRDTTSSSAKSVPSKTSAKSRRKAERPAVVLAAALLGFPSLGALAATLPEGGSLTYGQGQVTHSGKEMTITQSSAKMAIDWNSFNIGQGNKVTFVQPSSTSVAMNRVTGTDVSVIQGSLQANGQVFISNPNGVLFTKDAQVNVGSLVATTLQMSNEDLAAGRYRLQGKSDKAVTNQGSITATGSDGKGGGVALVAAKIINEGSITADSGTVALAAAHKVTLDLGGPVKVQIEEGALNALIEQGGAIRADGGTVIMTAEGAGALMATAINHKGLTMARTLATGENGKIQIGIAKKGNVSIEGKLDVSAVQGKAGTIEVTAENITLKTNASINANGATGGGTVLIGGDWQGSGTLTQAKTVTMEQGARIDASATLNGDGGKVVLWSDVNNAESVTSFAGTITTLGASVGKGGQVETSGYQLGVIGDVNAGEGGEWLLDPVDITISNVGGGGDVNTTTTSSNISYNSSGIVSNTSISTALSNRNNVTINTTNSGGSTAGNITVNANITSTSTATRTLTLNANASINIASGVKIEATGTGGLNLTLNPNRTNNASSSGNIRLLGNNTIATNGGNVSFGNSTTRATGFNGSTNGIEINSNVTINTSGGNISLYGKGAASSGDGVFIDKAVTLNSGSGKIYIDGLGGTAGGSGVVFFSNTGSGAIGSFTANASNNINITSTNAGNSDGWQSDLSLVSPITIKANSSIGSGMLINWTGGGANGSVNIYASQGHAKWIADGGNVSISAKAPVQFNANGAALAWGAKNTTNTPTVLPDISASTREFNLNVTQDLNTSSALNGMLSFMGTKSGDMTQNCGSGWIPTESQLQTRFISTKLYLGDSTVSQMTLTDDVNMASNTLELNAQNTLWTRPSFNSPHTIANTGTVLLVTDSFNLGANWNVGSATAEGAIEIMPITLSSSIGLGDTSGDWNITRANLQKIIPINATTSITIGGSDRTGDINFTDASPLALNGAFKLKTGGGNITLNTSSSAAGVADININGSLVLNTTGSINIGGLIQTTGNQTYIGNVTLLRDTTLLSSNGGIGSASNFSLALGNLVINQNGNSTLSGILSGSQTLTKSGNGTLTLTGNNTYSGVTTITNGTLALGDGGENGDLASQSIVNNDKLEFNSSADHTYTGIISGTGSLRKLGTGNLTLNATASDFDSGLGTGTYSSFTGDVFVDAGILKAANQQNSSNPTTSSLGNVASTGRTITVNNTGILEFSANDVLGNTSSTPGISLLINTGGTVRNNNTFVTLGNIVLSGGTLQTVGGVSSSTQAFNLMGNLIVNGTSASAITGSGSNSGLHLSANSIFTISDVTGDSTTDLNVSAVLLDGAGASGVKEFTKLGNGTALFTANNTYTGNTTLSNGTLIVGNGSSGSIFSSANIINNANLTFNRSVATEYTGNLSGNATANLQQVGSGVLALSGNGADYLGNVILSAGTVSLNASNALGSSNAGLISFNGGILQYTSNFNTDNSVRFSTASSQQFKIDTNVQSINFASVLNSSGGTLTKLGAGNLTLTANNTYSGATTISAGSLIVGDGAANGSINATSAIINSGNLVFKRSDNITYSRVLSGTGGIEQNGTGTLTLTENNTYTGTTTISSGSLIVGNGTSGSIFTSANIINNANLSFNRSSAIEYTGNLSGNASANLQQAGTSLLTFTGNGSAYLGNVSLGNGTLVLNSTNAIGPTGGGVISFNGGTLRYTSNFNSDNSARFSTAAGQQFKLDTNNQSVTLADVLGGLGSNLTKSGLGNLTLTANNTFTSATTISNGTLIVGDGGANGSITASSNILNNAALVFNRSDNITIAGAITGSGNLTQNGTGIVLLMAENTYTGSTKIERGTLSIGAGGTTGSIANILSVVNNGTLMFNRSDDISLNAAISGNGSLAKAGSGNLTLTGNNIYTGTTSILDGRMIVGNGTSGSIFTSANIINNGTLSFNRSANTSFSGNLSGNSTAILEQAGSGVLTFSGNGSAYLGSISLTVGTVSLNASNAIGPAGGGAISFNGGTLQYTSNFNSDNSARFDTANNQLYRIDTNSQQITFATALNSNGGTLTKLGSGNLTLTANNTYSGVTTISAGTLIIGDGATNGSIANSSSIVDNAALVFNRSDNITVASAISGNGSLTQNGTGIVSLTAANTYSGSTVIQRGTLSIGAGGTTGSVANINSVTNTGTLMFNRSDDVNLNAAISGNGSLTQAGSGNLTLRGNNTYTGNTTISGGTMVVGDGAANGSISTSANIINNANLSFNRSDTVNLAKAISGSGNVSQNGTGTLTLTATNTYLGTTTVNNGSLVIGDGAVNGSVASSNIISNANLAFNRSDALTLNKIISGAGNLTKLGSGNLTLTANNIYSGVTTISAGTLIIGDGATNGSIANSSSIVDNAALVFNRSDNITVASAISGNGSLTQNGSGIVSLTAANTYSGATVIQRGTLSIGAGGTTGSVANINSVNNNGTLMFNRSDDVNLNAAISGNGSLTQAGSGNLTLRGNNTYTGNTTISGGTMVVGDGAANGSISTSANIINNANLSFNRSDTVNLAKAISGSGNVSQNGTGTLTLTATNTYLGTTTVNNGSLVIGDGATSGSIDSSSNIIDNANLTFNRSDAISFSKVISGNGSLTKSGAGNLTLTANNTYSGVTTINAGTLMIGDGATNGSIANSTSIVDNAALVFNRSDNITVAAIISGNGSLTQNGSGIVSLTAANTNSGATRIEQGTLSIGSGGTTGSVANIDSVVNTGTLMFNRSDDVSLNAAMSGSGNLTQAGSGNLTLRGNNTYTGNTTISSGTMVVGDGAANGSISTSANIINNANLSFNRSVDTEYSGNLSGNIAANLKQDGSGLLSFSGNGEDYLGSVSLNAGTLKLNAANAIGPSNGGLISFNGGTLQYSSNFNSDNSARFSTANNQQFKIDTNSQLIIFGSTLNSSGGSLTKLGSGNLTLTANNTYTGNTTIEAGTLVVGDGAANGSIDATSSIVDNGTLIFNRSDNITLAKAISGTGQLTQNGSGSLRLTAVNTYSGATTINAGSLIIGDGAANGSIANTSGIVTNSDLVFERSDDIIQAGVISGNGNVTQNGSGIVSFTATNTYSGTTKIERGTLSIGAGGTTGSIENIASVINNGTLMFNHSDDINLSAAITGPGSLTQAGSGNLTLTGTNTYTGTTTIQAGTLIVGDGGVNGSIATTSSIVDNGTLIFNHSDPLTLNNSISGSGNLIKAGSGSLRLTATNTYTGTTAIDTGTLIIGDGATNGSIANSSGIVDNGELIFDRSDVLTQAGAITGTGHLTQNGTGTLTLTGENTYIGLTTINNGSLVVGDGATSGSIANTSGIVDNASLVFNRSDNITLAKVISGSGSLTKNGAGSLTLTRDNTYSGQTTINAGNLVVGDGATAGSIDATSNIVDNATLTFNRSDNITLAKVVSGSGNLTQNGTGKLSLIATNSYSGITNIERGTLSIGNGGTAGSIENITSVMNNGTLMFNHSDDINLSVAVSGSGNLTQAGTGVMRLKANNTYTGATTITSGTLVVGDGATNGSIATTNAIVDNGTLIFNRSDNITLAKAISGTGQLTQNGSGSLRLTAVNTYSGATTINAGSLIIGDGAANGSIANTSGIVTNSDLVFERSDDIIQAGVISGNGNVTQNGSGIVSFTATNTYSGTTKIERGTLSIGAGGTTGSIENIASVINNGTLMFNHSDDINLSAAITGPGSLTQAGSGNLTLTGNNTYTGVTTIQAGTLIIGDGGVNGSIATTSSIVDNGTLIFNHSDPLTLNKSISGSGNLIKAGSGSLRLTATNTYSGSTTINTGTLIIGDGATSGSIANTSGIVDNGELVFDRSDVLTQAGAISGTGHLTQNGTGSVTLTAENTYSGLTTINNGTLVVGDGATSGSIANTSGIVDNGILKFNRNNNITVSQIISGTGEVIQDGNGTGVLTLTGANTYTGQTTISNGTMVVGDGASSGSIDATSNIVNNATLTFNRNGNITVSQIISGTGEVIQDGNGTGVLTLTGTNTYTGQTTISSGTMVIGDGASSGSINETSNIVDNGTLKFNHNGSISLDKVISGTGNVLQDGNGSGVLTLKANNTYTGATTINSGTLVVGDGAGSGSIDATSRIVDNGTLKFNRNDAVSLNKVISGTGNLIQDGNGSGVLTLTANNTYTGTTTITSGGMIVGDAASNGSIFSSSDIINNANLTLNRSGTTDYSGNLSGNSLANLQQAGNGLLTFSGNGSAYLGKVDLAAGTVSLNASNAIGPANGGVISFNGGILQYTSNFTSDNSARFSAANNQQIKIDTNGQQITFDNGLSSIGGSLTKLGSGNLTLTGNNTYTGATTINAGTLIVGDGGINGSIDTTSNIVDNGTLIFNHSDSLTLAKVISGTGNLIKAGSGSLRLTATNTYSGSTTINTGTLIVGDGATSGSIANTSGIVDNGELVFDRSDVLTQAGAISGTGHLTQNGTGSVTLTAENTYSGLTTINNGTLVVGDGANQGSISNTSGIVDNASLVFNRSDNITLAKVISGSGSLTKNGAGSLTLTRDNTYSGQTTINAGNLIVGDGATTGSIDTTSNIVDNGSLTFNRSDNITLAKVISGLGNLIKDGVGSLRLTATNTYSGSTSINSGNLIVGDGATNGSIANTSGIVDNGTLTFDRTDPLTQAGAISGTGHVTQNGTGTVTLTGENTYTGQTTINSGTLVIGDGTNHGSISNTSGIVDNGILKFNRNVAISLSKVISGTGNVIQDGNTSGVLTLTGNNTYTGTTTITSGGMIVGDGATNGSIFSSSDIVNNANLTLNRSDATDYSGNLSGNSSSSLTKAGAGVLSLSGNGTGYEGSVNLAAGTLRLNATTAIDPSNIGEFSFNGGTLQFTSRFTDDLSAKFSTAVNQQYKIDTGAEAITFASALISNNGNLTKLGSGDLTLTGTNTYTGLTTITSGTLIIGDGATSGSLATTSAIVDNGTLKFNRNNDITVAQVISGSGHVTQIGAGSVTLTGENTYQGTTTITSGTLVVGNGAGNGSINSTSDIVDNGTLKFNRNDAISLSKVISGTGNLIQDGNGTGVLTLTGNNTFTGTTTISSGGMVVGDGATNGSIFSSNDIINNANLTLNRSDATDYSGNLSGNSSASLTKAGAGVLSLSGNGTGYEGSVNLAAGTLSLNATTAIDPSNIGEFSFNGGTLQFTSRFTDDLSAKFSTAVNQQYKIDTGAESITFASALISNNGSLSKLGSGNLTLTATNTYTGATTIQAGTLIVGDGGTNGSIATTSSIVDNGTLIFNLSDPVILDKVISGSGNLIQAGSGSLRLTATNTYTGSTTINTGTLIIGDGATSGSIANTSGIVDNGELVFDRSDALSQAGAISGTGRLTQNGTGSVTLTGENTYGGLTTINNGTLVVGDGSTHGSIANTSGIANNGTLTFNRNDAISLDKVISGLGQVIQDGNGTGILTLTANNTYTGTTTITSGTMVIGDGTSSGSIDATSNIINNGTLAFNRNDTIALNKVISGTGELIQDGNGTGVLTLTGTNTYTGQTTITTGTLIIGDGTSSGSINETSAIVDNGTLKFNRNNDITVTQVISGSGEVIQDGNISGVLTLTGDNTYTGATLITSGTLVVGDGAGNGSINSTSDIVDNGTLKFNRNDAINLSKVISGTGNLIQDGNGSGVITLTGNNTYTGTTTITSGGMVVGDGATNGSIFSSSNIINNANLTLNRSDATNYTGNLSGNSSASLIKAGAGVLSLSGNGTGFEGTLNLAAGTLSLNATTAIDPSSIGEISMNGGTLQFTSRFTDDLSAKFSTEVNQQYKIDTGAQSITFATALVSNNGSLTKLGSGNLTLTATNTYTGATTIQAGTLIVGDGTSSGSIAATSSIVDNGALKFNRNNGITVSQVISGSGEVIQDGNLSGVLTLTGANTYTGQTTIASGTLVVGDGATSGSIDATSNIVDNGTLKFNRNDAISLSKVISGTGNLIQDGNETGVLTITGDNTYTGTTTITSGGMVVGDGESNGSIFSSSNIINNANLTFNRSDVIEFSGNLSGSTSLANLIQAGTGTLTLSNNGSGYLGGISLNNGTVQVNAALALGPTSNISAGMISFNDGAIKFADGITTDYSLRFSSLANQKFNIDTGNQDLTLAGNLDSTGGVLTKSGNGTLTLTGNTTYTGETTIDGGKLVVGDGGSNGALGNTSGIVNNGELSFNLNTTVDLDKQITGNGSFTQEGSGTVKLTANNTYSGVTTISSGKLVVGDGESNGSLGNTSGIVNNAELSFNLNTTVNLTSAISGNGSFTQDGNGTVVFAANNNYSGVTTINNGTLVIGNGGSVGSIGNTSEIINNASLAFNLSSNAHVDKVISGSGSFTQQGGGEVILTANNNYTGVTTINNGSLVVGDGGSVGSIGNTSHIVNNANLAFNLNTTAESGNALILDKVISGSGSFTQKGSGQLTLSVGNTYEGLTNVQSGELIVTNAQALGDVIGGTVVNGGSLVVSGGIALANEAITLNGTGSNGAGALASRAGSNTVTGAVNLSGNASINAASDSGLIITGAINGNNALAAAGGGNFSFAKIGNATVVAGIDITAAASVGFTDAVTSNQDISVVANCSVSLNGTMTATGSMVRFDTTGAVTQSDSGNIVADRLALKGNGGNHTLTSVTNNVSTLAADTGSFAFVNAGNLTIGVVNPEGVNATGPVSITTLTGNLVVSENIVTTDTSVNALILNAGVDGVAGNATGGDIVLNGAAITIGSGGRASFYTGSVAGTTALAASIGSSTGHFRYNSDEISTNFNLAIGTGSYVIYREQPTVTITALDARKMYDRQSWTGGVGYACANCANGDSFYTMVDYGGTSQGAINVGYYAITPDGNLLSQLGYAIGSLRSGTLIVTPEFDAGTAGKVNKDDGAKSEKSLNPKFFVNVDKDLRPTESMMDEGIVGTSMLQDLKILLVNGGLKKEKVPFISSSKIISRR